MKLSVIPLAILFGVPLVSGCVSPPAASDGMKVTPVLQVTHADNSASGLYQLGRYYQTQNRLALAEEAYRKALALNIDFVEAHSALGALYAGQGKYDEAINEFSSVLRTAPQIAQIYNNLGYTYYLQGNHQAAVDALRKATALEPDSVRTFNNLGAAYEKLGQAEDARAAFSRAADLHAASQRTNARPAASRVAENVLPAAASGPAVDLTAPVREPAVAPTALPATSGEPPAQSRMFRLEIANGNGTTGLARRFADALGSLGQPEARLANIRPFREKQTVIEYRPGYLAEALRIRAHFTAALTVTEQSRHNRADVRLVLGHDVSSTAALHHPTLAKAPVE